MFVIILNNGETAGSPFFESYSEALNIFMKYSLSFKEHKIIEIIKKYPMDSYLYKNDL